MNNLKIDYLTNKPEFIPIIAKWEYKQWHEYDPNLKVAKIITQLENIPNTSRLPLVYVATFEDDFCGSVWIKDKFEMPGYDERELWLSSLFVVNKYQNQGIATKLLKISIDKAIDLNFNKISLFTTKPAVLDWYEKMGWQRFALDSFNGRGAWMLEYNL